MELGPLLVKVAAVNRLMSAAKKMKRVKLSRRSLFGKSLLILILVTTFLIAWTIADPPQKVEQFTMGTTTTVSEDQFGLEVTQVVRTFYCASTSPVWAYASFGWILLLLLGTVVLAIQNRNVQEKFNESKTLGFMTYSHSVFCVLRLIVCLLSDQLGETASAHYRSILLSIDTIVTVIIYFSPKLASLRTADSGSLSFAPKSSDPSGSSGHHSYGPSSHKFRPEGSGHNSNHGSSLKFQPQGTNIPTSNELSSLNFQPNPGHKEDPVKVEDTQKG